MKIKMLLLISITALLAILLVACSSDTRYSHIVYDVSIDGEAHLVLAGEKVPFGTPVNSDENKVFVEWFESGVPFDVNQPVDRNLTIVSQWRLKYVFEIIIEDEIVEVIEGDLLTEPAAPQAPGKVFIGWYKEDSPYDFSIPVVNEFSLHPRWLEIGEIAISGSVVDLENALESVTISTEYETAYTDATGHFTIVIAQEQMHFLTFSKAGFEDQIIEVDARYIEGNTYQVGQISLFKNYVSLGTVGGTRTPAWELYQTRNAEGFMFKASASMDQTSIIDGNHAVGFMVYIGNVNGRTTRNDATFLFEYYVNGRLSLHNYPNNIKRALDQTFNVETEIMVDLEEGYIDLNIFVPYDYFGNQVAHASVDMYDTIGISSYSYDSSDVITENLTYQNQTISFSNPTQYLRATHFNLVHRYDENIDTIITGNVESQDIEVYHDDTRINVSANGDFSYAFDRKEMVTAILRFESEFYETSEREISLIQQVTYDLGHISLDVIKKDVDLSIVDEATDNLLDDVSITYKEEVYFVSDGVLNLQVPIDEPLHLTIVKEGYHSQSVTFTVNQINQTDFNPTIRLISADQDPLATIRGTVVDAFGPLENIKIELIGVEDTFVTYTDYYGIYQFNQIEIADYQVVATYYEDVTKTETFDADDLLLASGYTLDVNFTNYMELGTIGGGIHALPPLLWEVIVTRNINEFRFKFVGEGLADNTNTRDFIEIYMHMGFEDYTNHTTVAHENMYAFNFRYDGSNVWRQIFNYPNAAKTQMRNDGNSQTAGISVFSSIVNGVSVLEVSIPYGAFDNLGGHHVDVNSEIPFSMLVYRNNGGTEPWYRPDLPGYVGNDGEVVRYNMLDNLFIDKHQTLYDLDYASYYSQAAISERFEITDGYQDDLALFDNLAIVEVTDGTMELLTENTPIFNDRSNFTFNQFVLSGLYGLHYSYASIEGSQITIIESGYVIVVADDALANHISSEGFTLIARAQVPIATTERVAYFVKYVNQGDVIELGKWSFFIADAE